MANTFLLKIITPSHDVYNGDVEKVFLKNADGELEILANHEKMITSTIPSIVKFKDAKGDIKELFVSTAIVSVDEDQLTISSDAAEFAEDIDFERARKAKERAESRSKESEKYNKARYELSMIRATERLKLKKH